MSAILVTTWTTCMRPMSAARIRTWQPCIWPKNARAADERGSATLLMVGVLGVLLATGLAVICAAGYVAAAHAARAAADLAALSGAIAIESGADGCAAARKIAIDNGARLISCDHIGDQIQFVISVEVAHKIDLDLPGLPTEIVASAHAGPR